MMLARTRHLRLQSSLDLFLHACRLWGKTFENDELLMQVQDMETELERVMLDDCPEEVVQKVETATIYLINNMDNFLKSIGDSGFYHNEVMH